MKCNRIILNPVFRSAIWLINAKVESFLPFNSYIRRALQQLYGNIFSRPGQGGCPWNNTAMCEKHLPNVRRWENASQNRLPIPVTWSRLPETNPEFWSNCARNSSDYQVKGKVSSSQDCGSLIMNRVQIRIRVALTRRLHHCLFLRPESHTTAIVEDSGSKPMLTIFACELSSHTCDSAAAQSLVKLSVTSSLCIFVFGTNFLAHSPRYLLTQLSTISHLRHS